MTHNPFSSHLQGATLTPNVIFTDSQGRLTAEAYRLMVHLVNEGDIDARQSVAVANLPTDATEGQVRYCPDEAGGPTLVFFDGVNLVWRRVQDRVVAS